MKCVQEPLSVLGAIVHYVGRHDKPSLFHFTLV